MKRIKTYSTVDRHSKRYIYNDNENMLIERDMKIRSTVFEHKDIHKET